MERMVLIPQGVFKMGFNTRNETEEWGDRDEEPVHDVFLSPYWIDRYEVTARDFAEFLNTHFSEAAQYFRPGPAVTIQKISEKFRARRTMEQFPANSISWYGADSYCRWKGKRLPTEAEWEKAARGTDQRLFPWGNSFPNPDWVTFRRKFSKMRFKVFENVASMPEGRSPFGLHHMAGIVWEWVSDWYDSGYYDQSPLRNPRGPESGNSKVLRGGNRYYKAYYMRTVYRFNEKPEVIKVWQGFRCARDHSPSSKLASNQ